MVFINANANPGVVTKIVANLYYPGYDADDVLTKCTDAKTGLKPNKQDVFLSYLARMNWRACRFAAIYGFRCADTFARFMASTYDANGDGRRHWRALQFRGGETEDDYVERITVTLRDTIRDANHHFIKPTRGYDYIQSDDRHATFAAKTAYLGPVGGTAVGASSPRYTPSEYRPGGNNRVWKKYGYERMGHAMSVLHRRKFP